jgi:hypothetical protein
MKTVIFIISLCFVISCSAFAQENYKKLVDSLRYVVCLPDENLCPLGDSISEKIIKQGDILIPELIEKILDITETEIKIADVHTLTVSDVAIELIKSIYWYQKTNLPPI